MPRGSPGKFWRSRLSAERTRVREQPHAHTHLGMPGWDPVVLGNSAAETKANPNRRACCQFGVPAMEVRRFVAGLHPSC